MRLAARLTAAAMALGLMLGAAGCASINTVSLTQIPPNRKKEVSATASRLIILGLNFDNDYVDEVSRTLKAKCPGGKVTGILTKDETYNYFLFLVFKRQITARGYCVKG